jgi:cytoskeleton protein RodZ
MSVERSMSDSAGAPVEPGTPAVTAGGLLRQAREAAGLHIAALAVSLKVPVKKLEALESDRYDLLPDAVFVRALASSVCRSLKIDPAPVLERLPQTAAPRLVQDTAGINAPFRAPSDGPGPSLWDNMSRPAVLAVLALLLGAIVLIFLPDLQRAGSMVARSGADSVTAADAPASSASAPAAVMVPEVAASAVPGAAGPAFASGGPGSTLAAPEPSAVASSPAPLTATLAAVAPSVALSTPTVASPTLVLTPAAPPMAAASVPPAAAAAAVPADGAATGLVTFRARQASWVEVTDARGTVTLRKTLAPGESAGAGGAVPLSVVVGKADATQVQVRGKPIDLQPLSRDNVARFEVK